LFREKRVSDIRKILYEVGSVQVSELANRFGISKETIRKDLDYLEKIGIIRRSFGGAIALQKNSSQSSVDTDSDPSINSRSVYNIQQKIAIAKFAVSFIMPNYTIILDASTTTLQMIQFLPRDYDLMVITNSLSAITELAKIDGLTVVSTGGELRKKSTSFLGKACTLSLDCYNVDQLFLSGKAVMPNKGLMDPIEREVEVKRKFISISRESFLLADSNKFNKLGPITDCPIETFKAVISDRSLDDLTAKELESRGVKVYRV
jgi:DeoR/GlpR family transcriptional regulator of sugar metabolism